MLTEPRTLTGGQGRQIKEGSQNLNVWCSDEFTDFLVFPSFTTNFGWSTDWAARDVCSGCGNPNSWIIPCFLGRHGKVPSASESGRNPMVVPSGFSFFSPALKLRWLTKLRCDRNGSISGAGTWTKRPKLLLGLRSWERKLGSKALGEGIPMIFLSFLYTSLQDWHWMWGKVQQQILLVYVRPWD